MSKPSDREFLQSVVFVVWIYEGVLPFVSRIFDWHPFLAFPTRLDAPWWWLVTGAAFVAGLVLMAAIDRVGAPKVDLTKR